MEVYAVKNLLPTVKSLDIIAIALNYDSNPVTVWSYARSDKWSPLKIWTDYIFQELMLCRIARRKGASGTLAEGADAACEE